MTCTGAAKGPPADARVCNADTEVRPAGGKVRTSELALRPDDGRGCSPEAKVRPADVEVRDVGVVIPADWLASLRGEDAGLRLRGATFRIDGASLRLDGTTLLVEAASLRVEGATFPVEGATFRVEDARHELDGAISRVDGATTRRDDTNMVTVADTAYSIAIVRADESKLPKEERLFDDPYAHLFAAAGEHAKEATQRFLELQLMREGVRLRTRFIDDAVREGLAAGLAQVVLLGAGFDARGMRMHEIAEHGASVFEVDFGYQLDRKREILSAGGISVPERIAYVPVDFEAPDFDKELTSALEAKGFRLGGGAIFVWEGVIGYISMSTIEKTMALVARTGGPGTRLVFTFSQFTFEPNAVTFAKKAGFSSCTDVGTDEAWRRYWSTEPHEVAAVPRFGVAIV